MTQLAKSTLKDIPLKGIAYACLAFFSFALMSVFNKLLTGHHDTIEIVFYRNALGVLCFLPFLFTNKRADILGVKNPSLLTWRVFIGTINLWATFYAVQLLPMSYAVTLFFVSALITPLLAIFLLKEHIGPHRIAAIIVGFCGVLLVAQPSGEITFFAISIALFAGVGHATVHVILRALKNENTLSVLFYFLLGGMLIPLPFMPFVATPLTLEYSLYLFLVGVAGCAGQLFLTLAFKNAPASVISPFNYTGLIWAILFDILIWDILPTALILSGAALIIGSNLYITYRENKKPVL